MNARNRLDRYLDQVRDRLRAVLIARASALIVTVALVVTCAAVWVMHVRGLSPAIVHAVRVGLVLAPLTVAILLLWRPLRRLRLRNGARELEKHLPAQAGRIETYIERSHRRQHERDEPLLDLLAEDAVAVAERLPPERAVPPKRLYVPTAITALAVGALAFLLGASHSYWGFGSRHLWFGASLPVESIIERKIIVMPGNTTVRKNQDLPIRASIEGFSPAQAEVHVRFGAARKWESAPMRAGRDGRFEFTLFALREPLQYYVSAGGTKSTEHRIDVVDLPRIERMKLTYVYPEWTGLPSQTDEASRDIQAVAGTNVQLQLQTSTPLDSPTLVVNGKALPLDSQGVHQTGSIAVKNAGSYRISARVGEELVPLTDDYPISLIADEKPTIEVTKPGRDWRASSIEELPVQIHAADDFRVQGLELRYAVNDGKWKSIPLESGLKSVSAETLLRLEDLSDARSEQDKRAVSRLIPGDLVSYYAVAKDRKQSVQTDLFLIHVQPFDRRYTQEQAGNMQSNGAGEQENAISERQREILLATWNLQRAREETGARRAQRVEDNARMLAELQSTLADQARTLGQRARARMLTGADEQIRKFVENLEQAEQAMRPAAQHLSEVELQKAIGPEQKALQHLMRAEALINEIRVAYEQGGGGGGSHAGRDLAEMFELEMDLDKNQYETQPPASANASSHQVDDTMRKLRELAQRQERLAREAQNNLSKTEKQQRWRQEQLRREAEDLRRKLAEIAQRREGRTPAQGEQGRQSSAHALNQVDKAIENMKAAAASSEGSSNSGQQSGSRSAREASRNLKQALDNIARDRREGLAETFDQLSERAKQLARQQRRGEEELHNALRRARQPDAAHSELYGGLTPERARALSDEKRTIQAELQALEREMRSAVQRHGREAPNSTTQLNQAADELTQSNVGGRLGRSAVDLERGRMLEAAAREGVITDELEALEREVHQAARTAGTESRERGGTEPSGADELLAELGELRRAWEQAQTQQTGESRGTRNSQGEQHGEAQGMSRAGGNSSAANGIVGEPGTPPEFREQAEQTAQRLRELHKRMPRGLLAPGDVAALKELADRLRGSTDPMQTYYAEMMDLVNQVELAALKAVERNKTRPPTRATVPVPDTPRYRENVAEYYRRLGDG